MAAITPSYTIVIQTAHINVLVAYTKANLRVTAGDGFKRTGRLLVTDDQLRRDVRRVELLEEPCSSYRLQRCRGDRRCHGNGTDR